MSGALRAVSSVHDRFTYRITQSGYWLIAAPASIIAVFTYDASLITLWICMAVAVSIVSPYSFYQLVNVNFEEVVFEKRRKDEEKNQVELKNLAIQNILNF